MSRPASNGCASGISGQTDPAVLAASAKTHSQFRGIPDCPKSLRCYRSARGVSRGQAACAYPVTHYRIDEKSVGLGIPVAVYLTVLGLLALWFHSLFQPQYLPNPGLAAYKPPPATIIGEMPARLLAQHWQAPPLAEIERPAEQPAPTVVENKLERTVDVTVPKRPTAKRPRARDNPYRDYARAYPGYGGYRSSSYYAFQGYGGFRPF